MQHLAEQFERESEWFSANTEQAEPDQIILSDTLHCGVPMEQYVGSRFVDWTRRCARCGAMFGSV